MRRLFILLLAVTIAVLAVFFLGSSAIIRALTPQPSRLTHLVVREDRLKRLEGSGCVSGGPGGGKIISFTDTRTEAQPYVVPAGRVFVVTDINISYSNFDMPAPRISGSLCDPDLIARYVILDQFPVPLDRAVKDVHLTGGVTYRSGEEPRMLFQSVAGGMNCWAVELLGYEVDVNQ